jgi:hypothetical protein
VMARHKCLSVKQPWANIIASGQKTIETRLWATRYRGEIVIVSSLKPNIAPAGFAMAIASLIDCRPMTTEDEVSAKCEKYHGAFAWVLTNIRPIIPVPVRGSLGIYEADVDIRISNGDDISLGLGPYV